MPHFTDLPQFVTSDSLVMFDPHCNFLPGATLQQPGIKIRFEGGQLLDHFPEQFEPFLFFGCDLRKRFDGTLFRFPLRTAEAAATSKLRQEAYSPEAVRGLLSSIHARAGELLLFVKNVRSLEVFVKRAGETTPSLFFRAEREHLR